MLNVGIAGAGALGTLFGTTLMKGGCKVIFMDSWKPLLDSMKKNPVAVRKTSAGDETFNVSVYGYDEVPQQEVDLIIVTVKSPDTDSTLSKIKERGLIGAKTVILTLQGGFDNPDIISKYQTNTKQLLFGKTACSSSACRGQFMTIQNFAVADTTAWALGTGKDEECSPRTKEVVELINKAGLKLRLTSEAIADRWTMLLYYPTNIAVSAVLNLDFGTCWESEDCREVLVELAKECARIAKLEGVDQKAFNEEVAVEAVRRIAVEEAPRHQGSMNQDVFNKRKTEIEATAGAILRLAKKHNVSLPYTKVIYGLMKCRENSYGKECQKSS